MNPVPDIFRILPEIILTLTGVAGHADRRLAACRTCRAARLGWVAAIGTTVALWASLWQLSLPTGTASLGTVETSPFTVFFHVLICGIVLVALLLSLDTLPEDSHHQGEYYALDRLRRGGHVPADQRRRVAGGLHRAGDFVHLHLHPRRLSQTDRPRP